MVFSKYSSSNEKNDNKQISKYFTIFLPYFSLTNIPFVFNTVVIPLSLAYFANSNMSSLVNGSPPVNLILFIPAFFIMSIISLILSVGKYSDFLPFFEKLFLL